MAKPRNRSKVSVPVVVQRIVKIQSSRAAASVNLTEYLELQAILAALESAYELDGSLAEIERRAVFGTAVTELAKRPVVDVTGLKREIDAAERAELSVPLVRYAFTSTLSLAPPANAIESTVDSMRVRIMPGMPAAFARHRATAKHIEPPEVAPAGRAAIIVSVRARSVHQATDQALFAADVVRGALNFFVNAKRLAPLSRAGLMKPINPIRLGRVHTLHRPRGGLAHADYWFERFFYPSPTFGTRKAFEDLRRRELELRRRLAFVPYGDELRDGLVRYVRALDGIDHESTFLKLWSVLEYLTGIQNARYDDIVRRVSFLFGDGDWYRTILENLRDQRNRNVHAGTQSEEVEYLMFRAKFFVERVLLFHLQSAGLFTTLAEACEFLSLSSDPMTLKAEIAKRRLALKFRK